MKQRRKSTKSRGRHAPNSPQDNQLVLQLDTELCVVNEISTPQTAEVDCLSENHELELNDVTKFLSNDDDSAYLKEKKGIPVLGRMKNIASGVFLQPRAGAILLSDDDEAGDVGDTLSLENTSVDCRGVNVLRRNRTENIETLYQDDSPLVEKKDTDVTMTNRDLSKEAEKKTSPSDETLQQDQLGPRQVNVSIQIKELMGISRITSKKKLTSNEDKNVIALVLYEGSSNDENIFIGSKSLPLTYGKLSKKGQAKASAKWPGSKEVGQVSFEPAASIKFSRPVMKPPMDESCADQSEPPVNDESPQRSSKMDQQRTKSPSAFNATYEPEIVSLQVSLKRGPDETIPLGAASIIIPWDYQDTELNIPVVRNCAGVAIRKKKKLFAMGAPAYAYFLSDVNTKYKIEEEAALKIRLIVSPGQPLSCSNQRSKAGSKMAQPQGDRDHLQWQYVDDNNNENNKPYALCSKRSLYQRLISLKTLRKQHEESHQELEETKSGKNGSSSSKTAISKPSQTSGSKPSQKSAATPSVQSGSKPSQSSKDLEKVQISVAENIPSIGNPQSDLKTDWGISPFSIKSEDSITTEASSVPLFELFVDKSTMETDDQLSEISDSDSSCDGSTGSGSRSDGGTLTYSVHSSVRAKQKKGPDMTENVIKFLTCDPTLFFSGREFSDDEKVVESPNSCASSSSSMGSTLSSSVYIEKDGNINNKMGSDIGIGNMDGFEDPTHQLPKDASVADMDIAQISQILSFEEPVHKLVEI